MTKITSRGPFVWTAYVTDININRQKFVTILDSEYTVEASVRSPLLCSLEANLFVYSYW